MKLTFLKGNIPLTKTYNKNPDGTLTKTPYPHVYEVTSIEEAAADLPEFEALLKKHAALGHCLLKGNPTRQLVCESRAGTHDPAATTDWIVFDVDGLPGITDPDEFLKAINLADVSYVIQYSASYKIVNDDLRCHIFMKLNEPVKAPILKQWLIHLNHTTQILRDRITLTRTNNALRWPLDITACQNDKLIYIAPPLLKGIKNPMGKTPRIEHIRKTYGQLVIPDTIPTEDINQTATHARINELRAKEKLAPRKFAYKLNNCVEVMDKPDTCVITDMKTERGFVYFNLNGGDSWGYYHPEDRPEFIYNFKGEPVYLTKQLLPEYWGSLHQHGNLRRSNGLTYLAFCDRKTSTYWRGTYNEDTNELNLYQAKSEKILRDFTKQHGILLGDYIPEWDLVFDPMDNVRVDANNRTVNLFTPSKYMHLENPKRVTICPPTIYKVLHHAVGADKLICEHFINWLAYILQNRCCSRTAWVLYGTTGTGKGTILHKILRPIFGSSQIAQVDMAALSQPYNNYMLGKFIVWVDEVEGSALINETGVMAKMRSYITEPIVPLREMYSGLRDIENYTNWIFTANANKPLLVPANDRRYNIAKKQLSQLPLQDADFEAIEAELQDFHDYLLGYKVDKQAATTIMPTEDRDNLIALSETSADTVGNALLEGNFEFFIDQLPTTESWRYNAAEMNRVEAYRGVLRDLMERTRPDGDCNISRDELRAIYEYTIGGMPASPNKFTSLLKHHNINTAKVRIGNATVYGLKTVWKDIFRFDEYKEAFKQAREKV